MSPHELQGVGSVPFRLICSRSLTKFIQYNSRVISLFERTPFTYQSG